MDGIDVDALWESIKDVIVKTIIRWGFELLDRFVY